MKKIAVSFFTLIFATCGAMADTNPFMGEYKNQIALNIGAGVNSGIIIPPPTQFVPFVLLHVQYSQPTTFFKVPARQSINIGQTLGFGTGYGWDWTDFTIPMIFLSEDIALFHGDRQYDKALELANAICANAQIAVQESKRCIRMGMQTDIATGSAFEAEAFGVCCGTADKDEGMGAFLEKRAEKHFQNK